MQQIDNRTLIICLLFVVAMVALSVVAAAAKVEVAPATIGAAVAGCIAVIAALFGKSKANGG